MFLDSDFLLTSDVPLIDEEVADMFVGCGGNPFALNVSILPDEVDLTSAVTLENIPADAATSVSAAAGSPVKSNVPSPSRLSQEAKIIAESA